MPSQLVFEPAGILAQDALKGRGIQQGSQTREGVRVEDEGGKALAGGKQLLNLLDKERPRRQHAATVLCFADVLNRQEYKEHGQRGAKGLEHEAPNSVLYGSPQKGNDERKGKYYRPAPAQSVCIDDNRPNRDEYVQTGYGIEDREQGAMVIVEHIIKMKHEPGGHITHNKDKGKNPKRENCGFERTGKPRGIDDARKVEGHDGGQTVVEGEREGIDKPGFAQT